MKAPHKYVQWAIVLALFGVGFLAFMIIAGDDDPANPLPLGKWFLIKAVAAALIYTCYRVGRFLYSLGLLASIDNEDTTEEEDYYE